MSEPVRKLIRRCWAKAVRAGSSGRPEITGGDLLRLIDLLEDKQERLGWLSSAFARLVPDAASVRGIAGDSNEVVNLVCTLGACRAADAVRSKMFSGYERASRPLPADADAQERRG